MTAPPTGRATTLRRVSKYLQGTGYHVLDSGWRQDDGTLDIVAAHQGTLVACVLTASLRGSAPPPGLSPSRQRLARSLAARRMKEHGLSYSNMRVDLIRHVTGPGGHDIEHVREVA